MEEFQGGFKGACHTQHEPPQVVKVDVASSSFMLLEGWSAGCANPFLRRVPAGRRFATPNPDDVSGLFVASCLLTRAPIGSENEDGSRKFVIRPYTPTSPPDAKGHFDLVNTSVLL